jgi:hypothetical protein
LASKLRSNSRTGDRDLADRAGLADHRIGDAADAGQRVASGEGFGLHAGGHGSGAVRAGEPERRDVPQPSSRRYRLAGLLAGDTGDAPAVDLLATELPAKDQRREDHHLRDRVLALDVRGRVPLREPGALRLSKCVRIAEAVSHLGQDEVRA